ncbi:MAG: hypothetical protein JOZ54_16480, partial [Acidobacteria bacterium]|nr:hypothetical protein [Acidobacteriota bacterium]
MIAALLPLLALTFGNPTPVAEVRTGATSESIRSVAGVAPRAGGSGFLTVWEGGTTATIVASGPDARTTGSRTKIGATHAALGASSRGPVLLWTASNELRIARLNDDGSLSTAPKVLATLAATNDLRIACNTDRCVAIHGTAVYVLNAQTFDVVATRTLSGFPTALIADPAGFLIAATPDAGGLYASRIDDAGAIVMSQTIQTGSVSWSGAGDFDGERYVLVYGDIDEHSPTFKDLFAVTLGLDGTLGTKHAVYHSRFGGWELALAWNGTRHTLAVSDATQGDLIITPPVGIAAALEIVSLDRNLAPLGAPITVVNDSTDADSPHLATSGNTFFLAYRHFNYEIGGSVRAIQNASGVEQSAFLTTGSISQQTPAIAAADDRDLALWVETLDKQQLRYRRLPEDTQAGTMSEAVLVGQPVAASIGGDWLTAWNEQSSFLEVSTSCKAAILNAFADDLQRIAIDEACLSVRGVAAGNNGWLVMFVKSGRLRVARITRSGQALPSTDVQVLGNDEAIASNGANFLVAAARGNQGVDLSLLDANGGVTATLHIDALNATTIAAMPARRGYLVAVGSPDNNGIALYNVSSTLTSATPMGRFVGKSDPLHLIPFNGGALLAWD